MKTRAGTAPGVEKTFDTFVPILTASDGKTISPRGQAFSGWTGEKA